MSLTREQAREIKACIWFGQPQKEIAKRYDTSQATISRILRGRQWATVPWPDGSIGHLPKPRYIDLRSRGHRIKDVTGLPVPSVKEDPLPPAVDVPEQPDVVEETSAPNDQSRPKAEIDEQLEKLREDAEQALTQELTSAIKRAGPQREPKTYAKKPATVKPRLTMDRVVRRAPGNKWVVVWKEIDDEKEKHLLGLSICEVFDKLDPDNWRSDYADRMISMTFDALKEEDEDG